MQEVVEARLVRYHDGRSDVQVRLRQGDKWSLLPLLLEQRLRVVQFIGFPDGKWVKVDEEHVLFEFPGCVIIESVKLQG